MRKRHAATRRSFVTKILVGLAAGVEKSFRRYLFPAWLRFSKKDDAVQRIRSERVDLIVLPSYTTLEYELTRASRAIMREGMRWRERSFPEARLAVTTCGYVLPHVEARLKEHMLGSSVPSKTVVWARHIRNTVHEAERIREELGGFRPNAILIVTGEMHSGSAKRVYRKVFRHARILVTCVPYNLEFQPDHLVPDQRTLWRWFVCNVGRNAVLRIPFIGFGIVRRAQHKVILPRKPS